MPKLFGTDGIRGDAGDFPLTLDFLPKLGFATGIALKRSARFPEFIIGTDTRQSSDFIKNAVISGLLAAEVSVIDIGVIPTPGISYLVKKLNVEGGIVISASHNPVEQNGIKIFNRNGGKLSEKLELEIETHALQSNLSEESKITDFGMRRNGQAIGDLYLKSLLQEHSNLDISDLKIVVDCANGAASTYAIDCFSKLGAKVFAVNASPTGRNINHNCGSEFVRKYPSRLYNWIKQHSANLGIAFDGDADRVVFVDDKGTLIDGDNTLAILSDHLRRSDQLLGNTIVATSMRNQGLIDFVKGKSLEFIETKVGDKYVSDELANLLNSSTDENQIGLGGEQAGHIILFDSEHNSGDGIRTALFVLDAFAKSKFSSFSDLAGMINKYPQVIGSAYVRDKPDLKGIKGLKELLHSSKNQLRIIRSELRFSGTEPLFRIMLEGELGSSITDLGKTARQICALVQKESSAKPNSGDDVEILNVSTGGLINP